MHLFCFKKIMQRITPKAICKNECMFVVGSKAFALLPSPYLA